MFKSKMIVFVLLTLAFTASLAYCQEKAETRPGKFVVVSITYNNN